VTTESIVAKQGFLPHKAQQPMPERMARWASIPTCQGKKPGMSRVLPIPTRRVCREFLAWVLRRLVQIQSSAIHHCGIQPRQSVGLPGCQGGRRRRIRGLLLWSRGSQERSGFAETTSAGSGGQNALAWFTCNALRSSRTRDQGLFILQRDQISTREGD